MKAAKYINLMFLFSSLYIKIFIFSNATAGVPGPGSDEDRLSSLLRTYVLLCGYDLFCNVSNIPFPVYFNESLVHLQLCPFCKCDIDCFGRGDCCPDLFFSLPTQSCESVDIMSVDIVNDPPPTYLLTSSCPAGTDEELIAKCRSNVSMAEKLLLAPVTSVTKDISITFLNRFCAECNGETEFRAWNLDISCLKFADFNFLSSYQEIIVLASDRKCNITFNPTTDNVLFCDDREFNEIWFYNRCNMTGTWTEYNYVIDSACSAYYKNPYGIFKNVFCYICNPQAPVKTNIISKCNETGMWSVYNKGIENACEGLPLTMATKPFRNIFCYLCNINDKDYSMYLDADVQITDMTNVILSDFKYHVRVLGFDLKYFLLRLKQESEKISSPYLPENNANYLSLESLRENNINLTNLLLLSKAFNNKGACDPTLSGFLTSNGSVNSCSCKPMCEDDCCGDFALTYPVSCISNYISDSETSSATLDPKILVVDGCYKKQYIKMFKDMCSVNHVNGSNIYEFLPVQMDKGSYRNVFCFLCNDENIFNLSDLTNEMNSKLQPWDMDIKCDSYIDYKHKVFLLDLIETVRNMSCKITLLPKLGVKICNKYSFSRDVVDKCNATGKWSKMNRNVQWACEEVEEYRLPTITSVSGDMYKNEFCYICNTNIPYLISSCNATGSWNYYNPDIVANCLSSPMTYEDFPYRNKFCYMCNRPGAYTTTPLPPFPSITMTYPSFTSNAITMRTTAPINDDNGDSGQNTFRSIFALGQYGRYRPQSRMKRACSNTQIYDGIQNVCRNLTCYPGKILDNSKCRPLMVVTKNLRYVLAFRLSGFRDLSANNMMYIIVDTLISKLLSLLNIQRSDVDIENLYLLANSSCSEYNQFNRESSNLDIGIYLKIFIKSLVPRLETETSLMEYIGSYVNISLSDDTYWVFESQPDVASLSLPSYITNTFDSENECFQIFPPDPYSVQSQDKYRSSYVQNVLLCDQIQFEPEDFTQNKSEMTVTILPFRLTLQFNEYQITEKGPVRVCSDKIQKYLTRRITNVELPLIPLVLLTRICLIVSLFALTATFITFCLFSQLRTLPGKNNMALIVALFFAQLSFFPQNEARSNTTECIVSGVLAHYFWLCVFGNFNMCSFHMYKVFSGGFTNIQRQTDVNKIVLKMALYSFGLPAIIVITNVVVTEIVTEGKSLGYGENRCFLIYKESFIVTLLIPMIIMSLTSIFCFSFTAYVIRNRPKVSKSKADTFEYFVYLKLFAVTGSTWIFQVIDAFLPLSFLSYIIAVLNGLQGLFIFMSYVCKKRVFEMYKHLCSICGKDKSRLYSSKDESRRTQETTL